MPLIGVLSCETVALYAGMKAKFWHGELQLKEENILMTVIFLTSY